MSNPNKELIKKDPGGYRRWLNDCLDPDDQMANEDGYWDGDEFVRWSGEVEEFPEIPYGLDPQPDTEDEW